MKLYSFIPVQTGKADGGAGFPFDFAHGGEPVEPRISFRHRARFVRNDGFFSIFAQPV
jgi:hypothetical protein